MHCVALAKKASDPSQKFVFLHQLRKEEEDNEERRRTLLNGHSGDRMAYPGALGCFDSASHSLPFKYVIDLFTFV